MNSRTLVIFAIMLSFIGQGSITILVPALPEIASTMHVSNPKAAQLVSTYLLGIAITSLFIGTLSDRFGRKKIIVIGAFLYTLSSVLPLFVDAFYDFVYLQFFQALGGGALLIMSHTIAVDSFQGKEREKALAIIYPMISISPPIAIFIGGAINHIWQWKSIYVFSSLYTAIILLVGIFIFKETLKQKKQKPIKTKQLLKNYIHISTHHVFIIYTTLNCLAAAMIYSFFADTPFILRNMGMSSIETGYMIAITGLGIMVGNTSCHKLLNTLSAKTLITISLVIILLGSILQYYTTQDGVQDPIEVIIPFTIMSAGIGLMLPILVAQVSHAFEEIEGAALGLYNFFRALACAATTRYVGEFTSQDPYRMTTYIMIFVILSIAVFVAICFTKKQTKTSI